MPPNDTLHILVGCESKTQLEACVAAFRAAGQAVRAHRVASLRDLADMLRDPQWDLLIAAENHPEATPAEALATLRDAPEPPPCIVRSANPAGAGALDLLRAGAWAVLGEGDDESLVLCAARAVEARRAARELAELRLQYEEASRRAELLLSTAQDAIAYVVDGMHVHANDVYAKMFGYPDVEELASIPLVDLIASNGQQDFKEALRRYRAHPEEQTSIDCMGARLDGSEFAGRLVFSTASYEGEPCMQVLVRAAPAATAPVSPAPAAAASDGAGGIDATVACISAATAGHLFLFAIDGHASHVRRLGVVRAHLLVREIGRFISAANGWTETAVTATDQVIAHVVTGLDDEQALAAARHAVEQVADHIFETGSQSVTCSICATVCNIAEQQAPSATDLLDIAWATLCDASDGAHTLRPAAAERVGLVRSKTKAADGSQEAGLDQLITQGKFRILFQPIVSLRGDTSEYYEVLVQHADSGERALRWLATHGLQEASGDLDRWAIEESLKKLAAHRASHPMTRLIVSVGLGSVLDNDFANWLAVTLRSADTAPESLTIQMSHQAVNASLKPAKQLAERLRDLGCELSVSDVHSANNPVADLLHVRPQFARIDESLSEALKDNETLNTSLKPLIEALHKEQIASVMPDVESANVLAVLWQLGVNFIQGNYLQPPSVAMQYDFSDIT